MGRGVVSMRLHEYAWRLSRGKWGVGGYAAGAFAVLLVCVLSGVATTRALAAEACPNEQLRIEDHSTQLPDCRAYELVTPPYMEGAIVEPEFVSEGGSNVVAKSFGVAAEAKDNPGLGEQYEYTRVGGSGWTTLPLGPPAVQERVFHYFFTFADLNTGFDEQLFPQVGPSAGSVSQRGARAIYIGGSGGSFTEVGPELPPAAAESRIAEEDEVGARYRGTSSDLSRVLFSLPGPTEARAPESDVLWPGDETFETVEEGAEHQSLYEYEGTGNSEPVLVGVSNPEALHGSPRNHEAKLISQCGTWLGSEESKDVYNAVSKRGGVVFFTAQQGGCENYETAATGSGPAVNELYARIDSSETVAISEPVLPGGVAGECQSTEPCHGAAPEEGVFQGASEDGQRVFFLSEQPLVDGAPATGEKLYEERLEGAGGDAHVAEVLDLSNQGAYAGVNPEVQGVVRVAEEGSRVYFVARGVLASEPDLSLRLGHQVAQPAEDNLYVYEPDPAHSGQYKTAFIAPLSSADGKDWSRTDSSRPVQATPDGGFLLFSSTANLTPDDTSTVAQLFRYDAQTGELVRISVGQEGFNDDGNTSVQALSAKFPSTNYAGADNPVVTIPAMSSDGAYVFFESADGLTSRALDAQQISEETVIHKPAYAENVYEYHEGSVYLISDGKDLSKEEGGGRSTVKLVGTDASGGDVFFTTADSLVAQDTNTGQDVYDARVHGGFPAPVLSPGCTGDACQGSLSGAPVLSSAGSLVQPGGGNLTPSLPKPAVKPKPKSLTRAQKLANALKACRKKPRKKRAGCKSQARKKYASPKAKKTDRGGK